MTSQMSASATAAIERKTLKSTERCCFR
jgi:hypothetical protein